MGRENTSLYSRKVCKRGTTVPDQIKAMEKALWHQVTTVVILRENMRQKTQSEDDAKFRIALVNMRYKACTKEDLHF